MKTMLMGLALLAITAAGGCATGGGGADGGGPSDRQITSAVQEALKQDETLANSAIDVSTDQGVVTLSGRVPNAQAYTRALSIARGVNGVKPPVQAEQLSYGR